MNLPRIWGKLQELVCMSSDIHRCFAKLTNCLTHQCTWTDCWCGVERRDSATIIADRDSISQCTSWWPRQTCYWRSTSSNHWQELSKFSIKLSRFENAIVKNYSRQAWSWCLFHPCNSDALIFTHFLKAEFERIFVSVSDSKLSCELLRLWWISWKKVSLA